MVSCQNIKDGPDPDNTGVISGQEPPGQVLQEDGRRAALGTADLAGPC